MGEGTTASETRSHLDLLVVLENVLPWSDGPLPAPLAALRQASMGSRITVTVLLNGPASEWALAEFSSPLGALEPSQVLVFREELARLGIPLGRVSSRTVPIRRSDFSSLCSRFAAIWWW